MCFLNAAFLTAAHGVSVINAHALNAVNTGFQLVGISEFAPSVCKTDLKYGKETTYVTDYLSGANNELLSYEGVEATSVTYGPGYGRLSQKFSLEPEANVTPGAFGFIESAVTQISNGEDFDPRKALGAAANGAVVGAARGAIVSSGAGLALSLAANFGAGAAGSALEQWIGGEADFGESMKDGLINAISGAIYGKNPIKSAVSAFGRGAGAGAATAAINNLANAWDPRKNSRKHRAGTPGRLSNGRGVSPYTKRRDPRTCGAPGAFSSQLGYDTPYGYQYRTTGTNQTKQDGLSLGSFMKDVLIGAAMGGLSGLAFYGADKKISALRNSIRSKGGSKPINPNDIRFSQSSVNGAGEIIDSMKSNGWKGNPIDVVRMPDGIITTIDNTRVLAARYAGINVKANIHAYDDALPSGFIERFTTPRGTPSTWGNAVSLRIGNQNSIFRTTYPQGSNIIGWKGN